MDAGASDRAPRDGGFDAAGSEQSADASAPEPDAAQPVDAGMPLCSHDPALVVCYPFDGDALDHGPRGNDLTVDMVSWDPSGGVLLSSASTLSREHRPELVHTNVTALLWVRVDDMPATGRAGIVDHDGQFGIFVHPGGELRCNIAGSGAMSAQNALQEGQWHHVACLSEGAHAHLYVDGTEVATVAGTTNRTPAESALHVGENSPDGNDQLIGAIDNLRILDAEWSAAQVAEDAARPR
jgi:hypothetical protein